MNQKENKAQYRGTSDLRNDQMRYDQLHVMNLNYTIKTLKDLLSFVSIGIDFVLALSYVDRFNFYLGNLI